MSTTRERHIRDIATGCVVKNNKGVACGHRVVGRGVGTKSSDSWRVAVCEKNFLALIQCGFRVKRYVNQNEGITSDEV